MTCVRPLPCSQWGDRRETRTPENPHCEGAAHAARGAGLSLGRLLAGASFSLAGVRCVRGERALSPSLGWWVVKTCLFSSPLSPRNVAVSSGDGE